MESRTLIEPKMIWTKRTNTTSSLLDVMVKGTYPISISWFLGSIPCILCIEVEYISYSVHMSYPGE